MRLNQLTGLRYFAALLVFLSHCAWEGKSQFIQTLFKEGYVGVSFFFVLSGFVLSYSYGDRLKQGTLSKGKYLALRLARVMPMHIATATPFLLFALHKGQAEPLKSLLNLCLLQSWIPSSPWYYSLNAPSWSLSDELFFYTTFIGLVFFSLRQKIQLLCALFSCVFVSGLVCTVYLSEIKLLGERTFANWLFYVFPGFRLLEFVVGMIVFELWKRKVFSSLKFAWLAFPALLCAMVCGHLIPEAFRLSLYYLPFVTFLLISHLTENRSTSYSFFSSRPLVLLGEASFAFYLIHLPIIYLANRLLPSLANHPLLFSGLLFLVISIASVLVFLSLERPIEQRLKQLVVGASLFNGKRPPLT